MIELVVKRELVDHHEADKLLDINIRRDVPSAIECRQETVETILNVFQCQLRQAFAEVGFLDVDWQVVRRRLELLSCRLVVIRIEFKQSSCCFVNNIDTVVRKAYFLGKVIAATILAIKVKVNWHDMIGCSCSHQIGCLHTDCVRHHRTCLIVREQYPRLAFRHAERLLLLSELQAIRFLWPAPAAVASALYLHSSLFHRREDVVTVDTDGGVLVVILTGYGLTVGSIDVDGWHFCPIRQPIDMNSISSAVRLHDIVAAFPRHKYGAAIGCNKIIDVLIEAQAVAYLFLRFAVHIDCRVIVGEAKGRRQTFANGTNRGRNDIIGNLAINGREELVVVLLGELERDERWEVRLLFAYGNDIREIVGVVLSDVRLDDKLSVLLRLARYYL